MSRSCRTPHSHVHSRSAKVRLSFTKPQTEHVLLLGKNLSTNTTRQSYHLALYSNCRRNSNKPNSAMLRAKHLFFIIPDTFKSSIPTTDLVFVKVVVILCNVSFLMLPILRCSRPTQSAALRRFLLPFTFRLTDFWSRANFFNRIRSGFGF